ncbi:MAG: DUF1667 domain-containing protein [Lachnospiraceae bacterium]|nr:DUF1667 domain-containing protein [Lachnospiraceae bacterium]
MSVRKLTCIGCPLGCAIQVCVKDGKIEDISGNTCKRGEVYARKEMTNPTRIVTSTVKVENGEVTMVSVKTRSDIPKEKIKDCIKELKGIMVQAPIYINDIIKYNVANTGVDVIATKNVQRMS